MNPDQQPIASEPPEQPKPHNPLDPDGMPSDAEIQRLCAKQALNMDCK